MVYSNRARGGVHGSVDTKKEVIRSMYRLAGVTTHKNLSTFKILDPAGGDGRFIVEYLRLLWNSAKKNKFDFAAALPNVRITEIDKKKCENIRSSIKEFLKQNGISIKQSVLDTMIVQGDFLDQHFFGGQFDLIIGNPPYIRYDNIPDMQKKRYRKMFSTFRHRSDIYIAFFQKSFELLSKQGKVCFICANRWLRSQYGEPIRQAIAKEYAIPVIINMEEADAFDEKVDAYPAITIFEKEKKGDFVRYYDINNIKLLDKISVNQEAVNYTKLPQPVDGNWESIFMSDLHADDRFAFLEEQGFSLGIGVATGADKVFIGKTLPEKIEKDLLLPLIVSRDINDGVVEWSGNYLLNPYAENGEVIDLDAYPRAKKYFEQHKEQLSARHVGKKSPDKWYKTIDKVKADLTAKPKLILPDMKKNSIFVIEEGKFYPHHNLYYITNDMEENLAILGAILNTDFVMSQMEHISNKMNGGYVRWQAQNLRKIKIPRLEKLSEAQRSALLKSYHERDPKLAEQAINSYTSKTGAETTDFLAPNSQSKIRTSLNTRCV